MSMEKRYLFSHLSVRGGFETTDNDADLYGLNHSGLNWGEGFHTKEEAEEALTQWLNNPKIHNKILKLECYYYI